ncbi:7260_t:CDS:2 [Cetraspora pellucida]|uniref:7260_t:CDS:1 n=1 Tax=Cetraspora pellucida TaxID=1433469 RepID=A0ACA9NSX2_9GLOM|nr:7260_t:CDS:2 [Cetraspora pellucida]
MKFKILLVLIFGLNVYSKEICKCRYNWDPFVNCCVKEKDIIKEKFYNDFDLYQMMLFGIINAINEKITTIKIPDQVNPPQVNPPIINQPKSNQPPSNIVNDYPKIEYLMDIEDIRIHEPLIEDDSFSEFLRLLADMNSETNSNNLADNNGWHYAIELWLSEDNYKINWNNLPANYKTMTHLYRNALYYKKMMEKDELQETDDIIPYVSNNVSIQIFNRAKTTFKLMFEAFKSERDVNRIKDLYKNWNNYINTNFVDDNFHLYKTHTSDYLAILMSKWIQVNYKSDDPNYEILNDLPPSILGNRRQRDDSSDDDDQRPARRPKIR